MNTFLNGNNSLNLILNDLETQTKKMKEEIEKINKLLSEEPQSFNSRIEKLEYKAKMFELISKKKALAFKLSVLDSNKRNS